MNPNGLENNADDTLFQISNLTKKYTGFSKIIWIATAHDGHTPHVKLRRYLGDSHPCTVISIDDEPQVDEDSLNPSKSDIADVIKFVQLNKFALLRFWYGGTSMMNE